MTSSNDASNASNASTHEPNAATGLNTGKPGGGDENANEPEPNGFWSPSAVRDRPGGETPPEGGANPEQKAGQTDDTEGEAGTPEPEGEPGDSGTDADIAGFLGMDPTQADGIVASLRAQQFTNPQQPQQPQQAAPAVSDEDIDTIIEDLAMSEKAAAAFKRLAKSNPGAAAAAVNQAGGQMPQGQQQTGQPQGQQFNPVVAAAARAAHGTFLKSLSDMGVTDRVRMTPGMHDQIIATADRLAGAMNAQTQADFEKALNLAYYAIDPDGVKGHFTKQGQEAVKKTMQRRAGMLDATQTQTASPRAGGDVPVSDVLRTYRQGGSVRQLLGR